MSLLLIFTDHF